MCRLNPLCNCSASTTVAYRPCTALTHYILWLSSALSTKCAVLIHYATVVLALQLHSMFQVRALCGGLMGPPPERPGNDMGRLNAPLRQPCGDAADFLRRPADEGWLCFRIIIGGGFLGGLPVAIWGGVARMAEAPLTPQARPGPPR